MTVIRNSTILPCTPEEAFDYLPELDGVRVVADVDAFVRRRFPAELARQRSARENVLLERESRLRSERKHGAERTVERGHLH